MEISNNEQIKSFTNLQYGVLFFGNINRNGVIFGLKTFERRETDLIDSFVAFQKTEDYENGFGVHGKNILSPTRVLRVKSVQIELHYEVNTVTFADSAPGNVIRCKIGWYMHVVDEQGRAFLNLNTGELVKKLDKESAVLTKWSVVQTVHDKNLTLFSYP